MNKKNCCLKTLFFSSFVVGLSCWPLNEAIAQTIIPDNTLPINSAVTEAEDTLTIGEGTVAGDNLFHSFQEFSLPSNQTALFDNNFNITNIFTRVTGGNISHIDGLIQTNGSANLFLINPNGLIFSENAALDVGGAFIGSTASEIDFGNNNYYSAINPNNPALLTITAPIGLGFTTTKPGNIVNQSRNGLAVPPSQTLRLIGGNIDLNGGNLIAESGSIEVGAILNGEWSLIDGGASSQELSNYGNIRLNQGASIEASGAGGGYILLKGAEVTLTDASSIVAETLGELDGQGIEIETEKFQMEEDSFISASTFGEGRGGLLEINATESVSILGGGLRELEEIISALLDGTITSQNPITQNNIFAVSYGLGDAGDLEINTKRLILRDGVFLATFTLGQGNGGIININASELVEVEQSHIGSDSLSLAMEVGNAGNVNISTKRLLVEEGGSVTSLTLNDSDGSTVLINASESVELGEALPGSLLPTGIFTNSIGGTGAAGDIIINTKELIARNGAILNTESGGIMPNGLIAFGGAGGDIFIRATDKVEIVSNSGESNGLSSVFTTNTFSEFPAGSIKIETNNLILNNASILVSSFGSGDAGELEITANSISLDNRSNINANTVAGNAGGNITLQAKEIQLQGNSSISTDAGNANGGNITIDTDTLVALENSDITANAEQGFGGRIQINAEGIFGTSESDITATSALGANFSGTVVIDNPAVDTSSGLIQFSQKVIDPAEQVVVSCEALQGNSFTITGRGGLPSDPTERLIGKIIWQDLQDFSQGVASTGSPLQKHKNQLLQATNWIVNAQGNVELIAPSLPEIVTPNSCQ